MAGFFFDEISNLEFQSRRPQRFESYNGTVMTRATLMYTSGSKLSETRSHLTTKQLHFYLNNNVVGYWLSFMRLYFF